MGLEKIFLGQRIRQQRETMGLSSNRLALTIGITRQSMNDIEHGKIWPSVPTLIALADALGVTTDWLLGRDTD